MWAESFLSSWIRVMSPVNFLHAYWSLTSQRYKRDRAFSQNLETLTQQPQDKINLEIRWKVRPIIFNFNLEGRPAYSGRSHSAAPPWILPYFSSSYINQARNLLHFQGLCIFFSLYHGRSDQSEFLKMLIMLIYQLPLSNDHIYIWSFNWSNHKR